MNLIEYCTQLEQQLEQLPPDQRPARAAQALQSAFKLKEDEIAIFSFDAKNEAFHFLWPPRMQASGSIPLKANHSLVAKTGRDLRSYLDNHFSKTPHSFIFEFVQDKDDNAGEHRPIQKIMSAPLVNDGRLCGVVQLSRKGVDQRESGAEFKKPELEALEKIAEVLARLL